MIEPETSIYWNQNKVEFCELETILEVYIITNYFADSATACQMGHHKVSMIGNH